MANRFSRMVAKIYALPTFLHSFLLTKLFCSQVKYANTTGVKIMSVTHNNVELVLHNKKKVQNHIGGIHATAAATLAESTSGIVFGMNVPDDKLPLLKSMKISYVRRMQGDLKAVATLDNNQIEMIQSEEKGDYMVNVIITDESGEQPIECQMEWAWITKRKK